MAAAGKLSDLERVFNDGSFAILIPEARLSKEEIGLDDAGKVHELLLRAGSRSQVFFDESLEFFVKLQLPSAVAGQTIAIDALLEPSRYAIVAEAAYLVPPARSQSDFRTDLTPTPNRGLGVRTPGFPYTPIPVSNQSANDHVDLLAHTLGPTITATSTVLDRWVRAEGEDRYIIWRMSMEGLSQQSTVTQHVALSVTLTCNTGNLGRADSGLSTSAVAPPLRRQGSLPPPPVPAKQGSRTREASDYLLPTISASSGSKDAGSLANHVMGSFSRQETLRRTCRLMLPVGPAVTIKSRVLQTCRQGDVQQWAICLDIANVCMSKAFRIEAIGLTTTPAAHQIAASFPSQAEMLLHRQDVLTTTYHIYIDNAPGRHRLRQLPQATPLEALITPSQAFNTPRAMVSGINRQSTSTRNGDSIPDLRVSVTGYPLSLADQESPLGAAVTTSFTTVGQCRLLQSAQGVVKPVTRQTNLSQTMLKSASLIGSRRFSLAMTDARTRPGQSKKGHADSTVEPARPMIQAMAGSPRHSIVGLRRAAKDMQDYQRLAVLRDNTRSQAVTSQQAVGLGAPAQRPQESIRGALPLHLAASTRPSLDSPRRSYSASVLPTLGSPTLSPTPLLGQEEIRSGFHAAVTGFEGASDGLPLPEEPRQGAIGTVTSTFAPGPRTPIGRLLVTASLLSTQATAASLGLIKSADADLDAAEHAAIRRSLMSFKLPSAPTSPIGTDHSSPSPAAPIQVFDVFILEVFVANRSTDSWSGHVRFGTALAPGAAAGIVPLDNYVRFNPLQPNSIQAIRARFLALTAGAHVLGDMHLVEDGTASITSFRTGISVVVN